MHFSQRFRKLFPWCIGQQSLHENTKLRFTRERLSYSTFIIWLHTFSLDERTASAPEAALKEKRNNRKSYNRNERTRQD